MTPPGSRGAAVAAALRGDRLARACLALIGLLVVLALVAPLLASNRPFVLHVPAAAQRPGSFGALPEGWSSPWLASLLDTRFYESFIDRVFNALLLSLPACGALSLLLRRARGPRGRGLRAALLPIGGVLAVGLAWGASHQAPALQYPAKIERLRQEGHAVMALYPPIRIAPRQTDAAGQLARPSRDHWLGTDRAGRDVAVRLLFGIRISLTIGITAVSLYVFIGVLLGALAGSLGGRVDSLILRLIEVVACFPALLLILTFVSVSGTRSIFVVMLAIGLTGWPTVARLVRAEFLRQAALDYAVAARALGCSRLRIAFRHLLPNALAPVLVTAAFGVAGAIVVESSLSFLALGDPSVASWGEILRLGRETGMLHLILAPGLLIFLTVTAMNVVAETLRDVLDPRVGGRTAAIA